MPAQQGDGPECLLDDGVRISHAPTGAEWEFDTVTTQQLISALLSTAHS